MRFDGSLGAAQSGNESSKYDRMKDLPYKEHWISDVSLQLHLLRVFEWSRSLCSK